ncbi:MAG: hypothetical protein H0X42_09350 [Solirubrobacterales bacterium]|nr:hypothetical protein [Solirubrobacterales bacterium]
MTELGAFLLPVLPLLFLLGALLLGRYPGHEAIVRLSEKLAARAGTRPTRAIPQRPPKAPRSFAPGGGLLIALGLAQRPPPRPA